MDNPAEGRTEFRTSWKVWQQHEKIPTIAYRQKGSREWH